MMRIENIYHLKIDLKYIIIIRFISDFTLSCFCYQDATCLQLFIFKKMYRF